MSYLENKLNPEKPKNKYLEAVQDNIRRSRSPSIEVELQRLVKDVTDNVSFHIKKKQKNNSFGKVSCLNNFDQI